MCIGVGSSQYVFSSVRAVDRITRSLTLVSMPLLPPVNKNAATSSMLPRHCDALYFQSNYDMEKMWCQMMLAGQKDNPPPGRLELPTS